MSKLPCDIVRDLLPLAVDGVAAPESEKQVHAHLAECANCRRLFERMQKQEASPVMPVDTGFIRACRRLENGFRLRNIFGSILALILLACIGFGCYLFWEYKTTIDFVVLGSSEVQAELSRNELELLTVRFLPPDGQSFLQLNGFGTTSVQDGIAYVQAHRPAWNIKPTLPEYVADTDEFAWEDNQLYSVRWFSSAAPDPESHRMIQTDEIVERTPVQELRLGTPEDYAVIYSAGDILPKADQPSDDVLRCGTSG